MKTQLIPSKCLYAPVRHITFLVLLVLGLMFMSGLAAAADPAIISAVKAGNVAGVEQVLSADESQVNAVDSEFHATPLHWAAYLGNSAMVDVLLKRGASPSARNSQGMTPLHSAAAKAGHKEIVARLIEAGAPVAYCDSLGNTALYYAVINGSAEEVSALLTAQASPLQQNAQGVSPLSVARLKGQQDIVAALQAEATRDLTVLQAQIAPVNGLWLDSYGATPPRPRQVADETNVPNLVMGGLSFVHGIGAHIIKSWTMPIPAGATQFWVAVGMRSEAAAIQRAMISFSTDDAQACPPVQLSPGMPPVTVAVDLMGKHTLTLRIDNDEKTSGGGDVLLGGALFVGRPDGTVRNPDPSQLAWSGSGDDPIPPGVDVGWPQWRGPTRNGIAVNCPNLADHWPPAGPKKLWEAHFPCPHGALTNGDGGGAVVSENRAYVYNSYWRGEPSDQMCCVDVSTQRLIWQVTMPGVTGGHGGGSTPCVVGNRVLIQACPFAYCLDASTGRILWQIDKGRDCCSSFCVSNGLAIEQAGPTVGVDLLTGHLAWSAPGVGGDGGHYGSPALCTMSAHTYALSVGFDRFECIDPTSGRVLWDIKGGEGHSDYAPTPAIFGDLAAVFFRGKLAVYRLSFKGPQLLWDTPFGDKYSSPIIDGTRLYCTGRPSQEASPQACCRDIMTGQEIWKVDIADPEYSSPVFADGKLFVLEGLGHKLLVLDGISGKRLCEVEVNARGWKSPTIANGRLYLGMPNGNLACFDLTGQRFAKFRQTPKLLNVSASFEDAGRWGRWCYLDVFDTMREALSVETEGKTYKSLAYWWRKAKPPYWVQYTYDAPREFSEADVYWMDNHEQHGDFVVPSSWHLEYKDGDQWRPVQTEDLFSVVPDRFNTVRFKPVITTSLRIISQIDPNLNVGILRWRLEPTVAAPAVDEPGEKYFDSSTAESIDCRPGRPFDNLSYAGTRLSMGSSQFEQGIGVHAPSTLTYTLGAGWRWLTFYAGISADVKYSAWARVQVILDGKPVCTTPVLRPGDVPAYVSVPIAGAKVLQLICTGAGYGFTGDHVNLCNVRLSTQSTAPAADGPSISPVPLANSGSLAQDASQEQMAGKWRIEGSEIVEDGGASPVRLDFGSPGWSDYEFSAEAMKGEDSSDGFLLLFRANGPKNYYWLNIGGWANKQAAFERTRDDNGRHPISAFYPASIEPNRWYKIRVRCQYTHIQAWLDDTLILDMYDDSKALLAGEVGIAAFNWKVRYRNLRVTSLDGKVLFEGLP